MKYTVSYSSIACLQAVTREDGQKWSVFYMADGKPTEVMREAEGHRAGNNHPEDLPGPVHDALNKRFAVVFAIERPENRGEAIAKLAPEDIEA